MHFYDVYVLSMSVFAAFIVNNNRIADRNNAKTKDDEMCIYLSFHPAINCHICCGIIIYTAR